MANAFAVPKQAETPPLRLERIDGGLCLKDIEMKLNDNQSPYMINLNADDRGALIKRWGQKLEHTFPESPIYGLIHYNDKFIVHAGTKIYSWDGTTESVLYSGLTAKKGCFFIFNNTLFYIGNGKYIQWTGDGSFTDVSGYIPTLSMGRGPTGGGTVLEAINYLQPGFKDSFSTVAGTKTYQLTFTGLDATTITATLNGAAKVENTDFTVNRTTGLVTLVADPGAGTNNLIVTAYKTFSGYADRIKNCIYKEDFGGGGNDARIFIAGNPSLKNTYWYSGLFDVTYFPEWGWNKLTSDYEAITGFARFYDKLLVFKETSVFSLSYQYDSTLGRAIFPVKTLVDGVGCDIPYSIQVVGNNPVFANSLTGVYMVVSTYLEAEKNVNPISGNINGQPYRPGLLDELNVKNAVSFIYKGKYYICSDGHCYVWDFYLTPYNGNQDTLTWFLYDNFNINCFINVDNTVYTGSSNDGKFASWWQNWSDFGEPINAIWKSKLFNFSMPEWLKNVDKLWITTRANAYSAINIKYYNDNGEIIDNKILKLNSYSWAAWDWSKFSWMVSKFAPTIKLNPRIKKVQYFQLELSNNNINENLSILSLVIHYTLARKVR